MQAWQGGSQMLASSGYVAQVDAELCAGCGECEQTCPFEAIHLQDGLAVVTSTACMGCGVCQSLCPGEAISLERDATRGDPLELDCLVEAIQA